MAGQMRLCVDANCLFVMPQPMGPWASRLEPAWLVAPRALFPAS